MSGSTCSLSARTSPELWTIPAIDSFPFANEADSKSIITLFGASCCRSFKMNSAAITPLFIKSCQVSKIVSSESFGCFSMIWETCICRRIALPTAVTTAHSRAKTEDWAFSLRTRTSTWDKSLFTSEDFRPLSPLVLNFRSAMKEIIGDEQRVSRKLRQIR